MHSAWRYLVGLENLHLEDSQVQLQTEAGIQETGGGLKRTQGNIHGDVLTDLTPRPGLLYHLKRNNRNVNVVICDDEN